MLHIAFSMLPKAAAQQHIADVSAAWVKAWQHFAALQAPDEAATAAALARMAALAAVHGGLVQEKETRWFVAEQLCPRLVPDLAAMLHWAMLRLQDRSSAVRAPAVVELTEPWNRQLVTAGDQAASMCGNIAALLSAACVAHCK